MIVHESEIEGSYISASWAPKEIEDQILELCRKIDIVNWQHPNFPIFAGHSSVRLRLAVHLSRIYQHFKEGSGGMLSAFLGKNSFSENMERNKRLANALRSFGYGYIKTMGIWRNPDTHMLEFERSFFIPDIPEDKLQRLAKKWEQTSYIVYDHGKWEERESSTGSVVSSGTGFHVLIGESPDDGSSRLLSEEERSWQFTKSASPGQSNSAYGLLDALKDLWEIRKREIRESSSHDS